MNSLPHITVLTLTYGRVSLLEECIASFLAQDYKGTKEMIVFNSFLDQELVFDHPEVTVINAESRPSTLGATRNRGIHFAEDGLIVICDDDDLMLPNHLSNFARGWREGLGWVRHDHQFYMEARRIKSISEGTMNTFAFTRAAWRAVGGYSELNVGEDRQIAGAITSKFRGATVELQASEASYLYSWDDEQWHISGNGEAGNATALQRSEAHAKERVGAMFIPTGVIQLKPHLKHDYVRMAQEFTRGVAAYKASTKGKVGLVMLGRYGDILNILPVAKYIADHYDRPYFFVAKEFASVLDGVSYVIPQVLDMGYDQIHPALAVARNTCELVISAQVWGEKFTHPRDFGSFNTCSWLSAGFFDHFHDTSNFPLVIDQRNKQREAALVEMVKKPAPMILCNLSGGHSSPFGQARELWSYLLDRYPEYSFLDISSLRAERIYDLLGLFDHSYLLITSDTATLHLATASGIPVIALVNDADCGTGVKWLASAPRCNFDLGLYYSEAMSHLSLIENVIESRIGGFDALPPAVNPPRLPLRKLIHAVETKYAARPDEAPRFQSARKSWDALYARGVVPAHYKDFVRDSGDIGDRALPYLKDVLKQGMDMAEPDDIVFWTNGDNVLHPDLPEMLQMFVSIYDVCTSHRCDFEPGQMPSLKLSPREIDAKSPWHMGRDLFAATKRWLVTHWSEIPDAILGAPMFDLHLAAIVRDHKGYGTSRENVEKLIPCCDLPRGYVLHEAHNSQWTNLPPSTPAHLHNSKFFREWAAVHCPNLHFHADGQI